MKRMNCPCSIEEIGLSQHWSSLALLSICLLYFRAPFRQQSDSAVEKSAEGSCASTPLGVITNRAVLGAANGTGTAGAASGPGKDLSAEEARERRRSVRSGLWWPLRGQLSRGGDGGGVRTGLQVLHEVPRFLSLLCLKVLN